MRFFAKRSEWHPKILSWIVILNEWSEVKNLIIKIIHINLCWVTDTKAPVYQLVFSKAGARTVIAGIRFLRMTLEIYYFLKNNNRQQRSCIFFLDFCFNWIILKRHCGCNSAGRVQPSQGWSRGFESRLPLRYIKACKNYRLFCLKKVRYSNFLTNL